MQSTQTYLEPSRTCPVANGRGKSHVSLQLIYSNLSYLDGFDGPILGIFLKIVTDACRWMISLFSRKSRARGGGGGRGALTNSDPRACATDQVIFPSSKGYQIK